ncbi:MAG: hypothetical protein EOP43_07880, partial [Sphingobacteriaceae bacterium]
MKNNLHNNLHFLYCNLHAGVRWLQRKKLHYGSCLLLSIFINLTSAYAQSRVTGIVTDERGGPLPGATVKVKNSTGGAATDGNGKFSIDIPGNATLVVNYIGFNSKEIAVKPGDNITVQLLTNNKDLN